jgi:hypothetical protein
MRQIRQNGVILALLVSGALVAGGLAAADTDSPGPPLSSALLDDWFDRAYEYMFLDEPVLTVGEKRIGMYIAGIRGIVLYSPLLELAGRLVGQEPEDFYDLSPLARLAGLPLFTRQVTNTEWGGIYYVANDFSRYNPAFVRWAHTHLIPDPALKIKGVSCREIYRKVYARFCRLLVDSRRWLENAADRRAEQAAYLEAMRRSDFEPEAYLKEKYGAVLDTYRPECAAYAASFTPEIAIGFWLRRGIDGTDGELWIGLSKLMRLYDREWLGGN